MKVAIIDHSFSMFMFDHCLCEGLVAQGCDVLFVGSDNLHESFDHPRSYQSLDHFYRRTNPLLKRWKLLGRFRKPIRAIEYVFDMVSLLRLLRRLKPDVVHFESLPLPMIDMFFVYLFGRTAKVVITLHDTSHQNESVIQFWGIQRCLRLFEHVIVMTPYSRNQVIAKFGVQEDRVSVIPHGVYDIYKKGSQGELGASLRGNGQTILFFGMIRYYKGLDVLITALSKLSNERLPRWRLVVAGVPFVDIGALKRLATELGINERITWELRYIPDQEVGEYFSEATVVVLPYREIDQSGPLHIAMAFAKPVVATDIGGFPDIVQDAVHGYLVPPEDPVALSGALERILTDNERTHEMSLAMGRLADSLSWDVISGKTVALYRGL